MSPTSMRLNSPMGLISERIARNMDPDIAFKSWTFPTRSLTRDALRRQACRQWKRLFPRILGIGSYVMIRIFTFGGSFWCLADSDRFTTAVGSRKGFAFCPVCPFFGLLSFCSTILLVLIFHIYTFPRNFSTLYCASLGIVTVTVWPFSLFTDQRMAYGDSFEIFPFGLSASVDPTMVVRSSS